MMSLTRTFCSPTLTYKGWYGPADRSNMSRSRMPSTPRSQRLCSIINIIEARVRQLKPLQKDGRFEYCPYHSPQTSESFCSSKSDSPSMSASQVNATHVWSYLTPEQAYQLTVSTHILAGTLAVSTLLSQFLLNVRRVRRRLNIYS
jgi:hypothetical protein